MLTNGQIRKVEKIKPTNGSLALRQFCLVHPPWKYKSIKTLLILYVKKSLTITEIVAIKKPDRKITENFAQIVIGFSRAESDAA